MRIRTLLAGVTMGAALLAGGITAPAQAVSEAATTAAAAPSAVPDRTSSPAAGWTEALSAGSPVRSCPAASCSVLWRTSGAGQDLYWYNWEINSAGNRWYELDSPSWGWIYCGNVTAPC